MSSVSRGILIRLFEPVEWHTHIKKVDEGKHELTYTEVFERPESLDTETFLKVADDCVSLIRKGIPEADVKYSFDEKGRLLVTMKVTTSLSAIAGLLASEFLSFTKLGDVTMKELFVLAGIGGMEVVSRLTRGEQK